MGEGSRPPAGPQLGGGGRRGAAHWFRPRRTVAPVPSGSLLSDTASVPGTQPHGHCGTQGTLRAAASCPPTLAPLQAVGVTLQRPIRVSRAQLPAVRKLLLERWGCLWPAGRVALAGAARACCGFWLSLAATGALLRTHRCWLCPRRTELPPAEAAGAATGQDCVPWSWGRLPDPPTQPHSSPHGCQGDKDRGPELTPEGRASLWEPRWPPKGAFPSAGPAQRRSTEDNPVRGKALR